jgi:hypothetical protein
MAADASDSTVLAIYLVVTVLVGVYCVYIVRACAQVEPYAVYAAPGALITPRRRQMAALLGAGLVPIAVFAATSPGASDSSSVGPRCVVCLGDLEAGDELRALTCGHSFHAGCVDPWLLERQTCPLCKDDVIARATVV